MLIQGSTPAITALAGRLLGERRWVGIALALVGIGLIVLLGNALVGLATLVWAAYTLLVKRLAGLPRLGVAAAVSVFGLLGLLPLAGAELALGGPPLVTPPRWLAVACSGTGRWST